MFAKKQDKSADDFWQEYEKKINEKILARTLGQYVSGWNEFDSKGIKQLWGLVIITSGGFRFHHIPPHNWMDILIRSAVKHEEKFIFIPKEQIISAEIKRETSWWKRIFTPAVPVLNIQYQSDEGTERKLLIQTGYKTDGITENLR